MKCDLSYKEDPIIYDTWFEYKKEITFQIPEHIAWEICDLFETEELMFPCFSDEFKNKLLNWMEKVV